MYEGRHEFYAPLPPSHADMLETLRKQQQYDQLGADAQREQHERSLQSQEQQRRMYDSETQRRKYGILGGLFSGMSRQFGGGSGMQVGFQKTVRQPMARSRPTPAQD